MNEVTLDLKVLADSPATVDKLTDDLQRHLAKSVKDVRLKRTRENAASQNAGEILTIILAAPAIVALAQGPLLEIAKGIGAAIQTWAGKNRVAVTFGADGSITATTTPEDATRLVEKALSARAKKK